MKRSGPPARKTPLKADPAKQREWQRRSAMQSSGTPARGTPLKQQSNKKAAERREREPIRQAVLERDGHRCQMQKVVDRSTELHDVAGRCYGRLEVHHLDKESQGGAYTLTNLLTLCATHNLWVENNPTVAHRLGLVIRRGDRGTLDPPQRKE